MRISFIIPVKNGHAFIGRCIERIRDDAEPNDEIIVVDNGSSDDTVALARQAGADTVAELPDVTIAALRNHGATLAEGDVLAFIDADCLVCSGWRRSVERVLSDPEVSATGSFYDLPEQTTWVERAWWSFRPQNEHRSSFLISGNFVVRAEVYASVGGFDESLVTDEDTDISRRLTYGGHVMVEAPSVRVVHLGNAKTLRHFFGKEKWHAQGIVDTIRSHPFDLPMLLTAVFVLGWIVALVAPFVLGARFLWVSLLAVAFAPTATSAYKVMKHGNYRYFLHLIPLYFIVYSVRTMVISAALVGRRPA